MGRPPAAVLIALLALCGCSQTTTSLPSTTLAPLPVVTTAPTTTVLSPPTTSSVEGYGITVIDGRTFQFSVGPQTSTVTIQHLTVPDPSTCEGTQAKNLLGSIIIGHLLRVTSAGTVWKGDLDVGMTMVAYGMANPSDEWYQMADTPVDFDCSATTTTAAVLTVVETPAPPVQQPRPRPATTKPPATKPPATKPKRTTPPATPAPEPEPPPATEAPRPPVAEPPQTDAPAQTVQQTEPEKEKKPKKSK
jgi:hypothetical protein